MLNSPQQNKILEIWDYYIANGKKFINASKEYTQEELDKARLEVIKTINKLIADYIKGEITLENFRAEIDSLNKRHRLWGFKGISGQMYFNMLYNVSTGAGLLDKLDSILKQCIAIPADLTDALSKIDLLSKFSDSLANYTPDKKQAPRTGSCNFFISYFWQIQDHTKWPIYYKSMIDVLLDTGLWSPSGDLPKNYEEFYNLNYEIKAIIETKTKKPCSLWDVEHALWLWGQKDDVSLSDSTQEIAETQYPATELPASFIPPVVSIIPLLAKNDPKIAGDSQSYLV